MEKWPAQSPDLNPIEHVWSEPARKLRRIKYFSFEEVWRYQNLLITSNKVNLKMSVHYIFILFFLFGWNISNPDYRYHAGKLCCWKHDSVVYLLIKFSILEILFTFWIWRTHLVENDTSLLLLVFLIIKPMFSMINVISLSYISFYTINKVSLKITFSRVEGNTAFVLKNQQESVTKFENSLKPIWKLFHWDFISINSTPLLYKPLI